MKISPTDWAVIHVSIIRTPKQAGSDDLVLERLLEDAESNLQWKKYYIDERIRILPQGLWFMKKTLYRRLQIVASYLHALKSRRLQDGKSTHCIPVTLMVELILRSIPLVDFGDIDNILRATAVPFCPEFGFDTVRKDLMRIMSYGELRTLRVLIKMHVRTPILKPSRAVGKGDSDYESDEDIVRGSEKWIEKQVVIEDMDGENLFSSGRSTIAHIEVMLLKPVLSKDK